MKSFNPERASQAIPTWSVNFLYSINLKVSIPNGLPRPFRLDRLAWVYIGFLRVSIPNGLPRPFRLLLCRSRSTNFLGFNPERASQAIPTGETSKECFK